MEILFVASLRQAQTDIDKKIVMDSRARLAKRTEPIIS